MASTVTKQQQYRRLMREQKAKATASSAQQEKIKHPLAKYNNLGHLTCVVCGLHIKSEILWSTHLQSRKHKDSVAELKAKGNSSSTQSLRTHPHNDQPKKGVVLKSSDPPSLSSGKRKNDEDALTNENPPPKRKKKSKARHSSKNSSSGLPSGFFDSSVKKKFIPHGEEVLYDSSESEDDLARSEDVAVPMDVAKDGEASSSMRVTDSSNNKVEEMESQDSSQRNRRDLPEGFFDDPKKDAKARMVDYKDPLNEEWERFQKSIQKENDVSEALVFEGDEETMEERELEEVNEQVTCFTKAEELRKKHEDLLDQRSKQSITSLHDQALSDSNSSDDETEFNELLSWRAKIS